MKIEEKEKIIVFLKTGLVVLSSILLLSIGMYYVPKSLAVFSQNTLQNQKKLPIYCVDRIDQKVSLSFDAAWGNGKLG